ncbi:MAG: helix-hairpin-helix domain-containing protein [Chlorobium sp.]
MTYVLFMALFLLFPPALYGEEDALLDLLESAESAGNAEQLLELIEDLKKNRILLNEADANELRQLPWLTAADAHAIIVQRNAKGAFQSLQELEPIIGAEKTAAIAPCVLLKKEQELRKRAAAVPVEGTMYSRLFRETTARKGIIKDIYAGENYKLYHRLQVSVPHVNASLLQEKDIGEPDVADFTSLSFNIHDLGILKSAVLGNYKLNVAQGLLIGQGRYLSKGSDSFTSVRLPARQLSPYTSSSEYGYLQGVAATVKLYPIEVTAFYSANHLDAIINSSGVITSFDESGYHRTPLEISRKDNVTETVSGANLLYNFQTGNFSGRAGGSVLSYGYTRPLDELEPYAALSTISSAMLYSIQTDCSLGKATLFGEAAFSRKPYDTSWIAGMEYELLRGLNAVGAVRRYGVNYYSPFASAFAERGEGASNENGYYVGINAKASDRLSIGAYYDLFTFPLLDDHTQYPSHGNDSRIFLAWKQSGLLLWHLQLQHKKKEEQNNQGSSSAPLWTALPQVTDRCRLDCDLLLSTHFHLRSRGEFKKVVKQYLAGDQQFYGRLFYQQAGYESPGFSLKGRFTHFQSDDYDAALYAYEDDLPLTSSLGLYSGRGNSFFLLATWQAMKQMELSARFEKTWYSDREVYSSGNDERATNAPGSFHLGCFITF